MMTQGLWLLLAMCWLLTGCLGEDDCTPTRDGCKLDDGRCICGHGCYTEYRYNNKAECQKAARGVRLDICQSNPCRHRGTCSQISVAPGFKCRCEGTGYYGQRCDRACPKLSSRLTREFPFECIVI